MSLTDLLWLATAAYGLGNGFYVVNALVVVLGIVGANLAGHHPGIALAFPALMLINATFFHVLPFALT
jgi:hypothetical protein